MNHWRNILGPVIEDRRFLLALDVLVRARSPSNFLHEFGALSTFAVAALRGVGDIPEPEQTPCIDLDLPPAADMISGIRTAELALRELPAEVQAQIDAWDPEHTARVISTIFSDGSDIAGRRQLGGRPPVIRVGTGPTGSIVFLTPDPDKIPIGPSLAPRIAAMAAAAD